jgi:hypothetical protein
MKHQVLLVFLVAFFFLVFAKNAEASLLVIDKEGNINWKVLSYESSLALDVPGDTDIEVTKFADDTASGKTIVTLKKENDRITLSEVGGRELDVSSWENDVIEVEERGDVKKLKVTIDDGKFALEQDGVKATTEYPIEIDARENKISVETETGYKYLALLPYDAAQSLLRTKIATNVNATDMKVVEYEKDITYLVNGEKAINIFNIYDLKLPVSAYISASTGEVMMVEPSWLGVVNYLLL